MGKSIVVSFIADAAGLGAEVDKVQDKVKGMGESLGAFGVKAAAGVTTLGAGLTALGKPIEDAKINLENAVKNTGGSMEAIQGKLDATTSKMQSFGHGTADTDAALAKLTVRLNDPAKAMADMGAVAEVAAFKHISLSDAADLVGKAAQGNAKVMKQFGLEVDNSAKLSVVAGKAQDAEALAGENLAKAKQHVNDVLTAQHAKHTLTLADHVALRNAQDAVSAASDKYAQAQDANTAAQTKFGEAAKNAGDPVARLGDKLKGVAEDQANTFVGKIEGIKTKLEDFVGTLGQHVGPAMVTFGPALAGLGPAFNIAKAGVTGLGAAMDFLAANPIVLIIAAIVAFVVILVVAYEKIGWFRDFVNAAFSAVGSAISGVFGWVKDHWPLLLDILLGPFGFALGFIIKNWSGLTDWFGGLFAGIAGVFKVGVNWIIDLLNAPIKAFDSVTGLLSKIPGVPNIQIPQIPHMAAGGIVNGPTLALIGEAGPEAVVPLSGGHGAGGTSVTVIVQGSLLTVPDLIRQVRAGIQNAGRLNVTALNGFA